MAEENKKSKIIRGKLYYIFPMTMDIYGEQIPASVESSFLWKRCGWVADFIDLMMSALLKEDNMYLIKLNKKDMANLTEEERAMISPYR